MRLLVVIPQTEGNLVERRRVDVNSDGSSSEGDYPYGGRRYWLMALGRKSEFWDNCYVEGIAIIGWDDVGDLRGYDSRDQLHQSGIGTNDSKGLWQFCNEMKRGDIILVKKGSKLVVGPRSRHVGLSLRRYQAVFQERPRRGVAVENRRRAD